MCVKKTSDNFLLCHFQLEGGGGGGDREGGEQGSDQRGGCSEQVRRIVTCFEKIYWRAWRRFRSGEQILDQLAAGWQWQQINRNNV